MQVARAFPTLQLSTLAAAYDEGATPRQVVEALLERIDDSSGAGVWIHRVPADELRAAALGVEEQRRAGRALPLAGVPFAVKDNIDVVGMPTTAACPAFSRWPGETAPVVQRLLDAGALLVGKTNLDQFATGLVGTRSPYGVPVNPFDERYIVGGSSSGSAAAVSRGMVAFALGTDTAGSGRVPAAFNNIVGYKPGRGLLGTRGVVPTCRSLDCVSLFALTAGDARAVAAVAAGYDSAAGVVGAWRCTWMAGPHPPYTRARSQRWPAVLTSWAAGYPLPFLAVVSRSNERLACAAS